MWAKIRHRQGRRIVSCVVEVMVKETKRLPGINFPYLSELLIELPDYQKEIKPILIKLVELERSYYYHTLKDKVKVVQSANHFEDLTKLNFFCIDLLENERSNYLKFIRGFEPAIFLAPNAIIETINEFEKEKNIESVHYLKYMINYMKKNGILYESITSLGDIISALKALKNCKNLETLQLIQEGLMANPEKLDLLKDLILNLEKKGVISIPEKILADITTPTALDALKGTLYKRKLFEKTVQDIKNGR